MDASGSELRTPVFDGHDLDFIKSTEHRRCDPRSSFCSQRSRVHACAVIRWRRSCGKPRDRRVWRRCENVIPQQNCRREHVLCFQATDVPKSDKKDAMPTTFSSASTMTMCREFRRKKRRVDSCSAVNKATPQMGLCFVTTEHVPTPFGSLVSVFTRHRARYLLVTQVAERAQNTCD